MIIYADQHLADKSTFIHRVPCRALRGARPHLVSPVLLSAIVWLVIAGCVEGGRDLSDREAKNTIEGEIDTWGLIALPLGQVAVVEAGGRREGQISLRELKDLEAWSKAGLVTLSADDGPSPAQSFTWEQWFLRSSGQSKRLTVAPTTAGLSLQARTRLSASEEDSLRLPRGRFQRILYARLFSVAVEKLVENKHVSSTTRRYRFISGVLRQNSTEEVAKVSRAAGRPIADRKKFEVLLEYDPFEEQWRSVTWDLANVEQPFSSRNVEDYVARISE